MSYKDAIPQLSAGRVRSTPSSTSASARIRRAALASRHFPAADRKSDAVNSPRMISIPAMIAPRLQGQ